MAKHFEYEQVTRYELDSEELYDESEYGGSAYHIFIPEDSTKIEALRVGESIGFATEKGVVWVWVGENVENGIEQWINANPH